MGIIIEDNKKLERQYQMACEAYTRKLCERFGWEYDDCFWVNDDVGGTFCVGGTFSIADVEYSLGMDEIRDLVRYKATYNDFSNWLDYNMAIEYAKRNHPNDKRFFRINIRSWMMNNSSFKRVKKEVLEQETELYYTKKANKYFEEKGNNHQNAYKAGDICFYDREADKLIIVPFKEWSVQQYPSSRFSPIGVVVIPGTHDVYGTGQCGVMSLKEMNDTTPDYGSTSHQYLYWGQNNVGASLPNLNVCVITGTITSPTAEASGTYGYSYLPSDSFSGTECPTDSVACYFNVSSSYYAAPSPYLEDGLRNSVYYQTESPSSTLNCLADFNGVGNTEVLCDLATAQPNWKTDDAITDSYDSGYSPAACCCWRFHTEGTKQGDWYLPAAGELGYMMVRLKTINETINNLINAYGSDVGVSVATSNYYWSSSEFSSNYARLITTNFGGVFNCSKGNGNYVRAFLRL